MTDPNANRKMQTRTEGDRVNTDLTFNNDEYEVSFIPDSMGDLTVYAPLLAKQLGYRDAHNMLRVLDDDEKVQVNGYTGYPSALSTPPGQHVWHVTEPGFYKVVGQRNVNLIKDPKIRDAVYRFQRWVFHEVLPSMLRAGTTGGPNPGSLWDWDDIAAQLRQRYQLDYRRSQITMGMRAAGWLKAGSCTPKHEYRNRFWHTGSAYLLCPHVLPELAHDLVKTLREIGEPQAQQYQLTIFPAESLRVIEGGAAS